MEEDEGTGSSASARSLNFGCSFVVIPLVVLTPVEEWGRGRVDRDLRLLGCFRFSLKNGRGGEVEKGWSPPSPPVAIDL